MRKSELAILAALADVLAIAKESAKGTSARAKIAKGELLIMRRTHAPLVEQVDRFARLRAHAEPLALGDEWLHGAMATGLDIADIEKGCEPEAVHHAGQRLWGVRAPNGLHITGIPVE